MIFTGQYDFSYELPDDFATRVTQLLQQAAHNTQLASAFRNCIFEYEDLGIAFYAGLKGDNWDKHALDFTFEGSNADISVLREGQSALKEAMERSLRPSTSGFLIKDIYFLTKENAMLPSSEEERLNADIVTANAVLSDLVRICERLSTNATYTRSTSEDSINDFIRDALLLMGYCEVKDQTRHGVSESGKNAGEVDILISKDGKEVAIFEGMKLDCVASDYIDKHISKAIVNYNSLGTATFIVAYVSAGDFESFWGRYVEHIKCFQYLLKTKRELAKLASPNAAVRIATAILSRDGFDFPVYYLAVNIN